jgi:hypothetical protein
MKDAFHGSARLAHGLVTEHRGHLATITRPYRGTSRQAPIRGTARTAPKWIQRAAGGHGFDRVPPIILEVDAPWGAIPCWSGRARRWALEVVPAAYKERYDSHVRPAMPNNPVSVRSVVAVAVARASFADHRTGRNCRPTNDKLAVMTGLSVRTVQRASTALRLLGVATEVMRGRQRTRDERFASWRVGDRGRGWASVWALHDSRFQVLSSHPGGSKSLSTTSSRHSLTTASRKPGSSGASRRPAPDKKTLALANRWVADQQSPPWARRYRTGTPWVHVLHGPAQHGWTPRDLNQLIADWVGTGHWIPESPYKPIGLLGKILAVHENLEDRPALLDDLREQEELARARERVAAQMAERRTAEKARQAGLAALSGPGRDAVRRAMADIAERQRRRTIGDDAGLS